MKQIIILVLFLLQSSLLFAQQEKSLVKTGNELYLKQKYKEAEDNYRKSIEKNPDNHRDQNVEGNFNLGDALYKQKKFADAGEQFNKIGGSAGNNKAIAAQAYHNLGNSFLENKKLEESIDAYKKSLLNNPKDDETRYNLAYAQEKLKKQQQDKKNQDNKNQDKKNQDNKNQDKKNQDNKNKDNKNKDDKNKDNKNQDNKNKQNQNQDKKDQQKQPDKISKEDAERMLDALNNDEKQTQDKLKNKKLQGAKMHITKDW